MIPFNPPDVVESYTQWRATCGAAALAAWCGVPLAAVRGPFAKLGYQGWTNPTMLAAAAFQCGCSTRPGPNGDKKLPLDGLATLQIVGPWCAPGVPPKAAYRYLHIVAVRGTNVYDINDSSDVNRMGGWLPFAEWLVLMGVIVGTHPRATDWRVKASMELVHEEPERLGAW